jgi:molybdopterin synthase catalytic subunit
MTAKIPPALDAWLHEIKADCPPESLGMILFHSGLVRASSKKGERVEGMILSYDQNALDEAVRRFRLRDGIAGIRVWINEGTLAVGDDIMRLCVAGRYRADILPVFQELLSLIKSEIVREQELG